MFPPPRQYYSQRNDPSKTRQIDREQLKALVRAVYLRLRREGYFQQALGYQCVDAGDVSGTLGNQDSVEAFVFLRLRTPNLWPFDVQIDDYSDHELFDMIELLFDIVSKPTDNYYHSYGDCGYHYSKFDQAAGQQFFRDELNVILADYQSGYELSREGEILELGASDQRALLTEELPAIDPKNINERVNRARNHYRRFGASLADRRNAVRELADVLEFLRPQLKGIVTSKDEGELFNIANNFGIRHHNDQQKDDYDKGLWLDWMFYYYLNTITMVTKALAKRQVFGEPVPDPLPAEAQRAAELWWDDDVSSPTEFEDLPF